MGTDNLFHKRKAKKAGDLARRKARRAPYAKELIVCEGEKTEPYYFKSLKDHTASTVPMWKSVVTATRPRAVSTAMRSNATVKKEMPVTPLIKCFAYSIKILTPPINKLSMTSHGRHQRAPSWLSLQCPALNIGCCCISTTPQGLMLPCPVTVLATRC